MLSNDLFLLQMLNFSHWISICILFSALNNSMNFVVKPYVTPGLWRWKAASKSMENDLNCIKQNCRKKVSPLEYENISRFRSQRFVDANERLTSEIKTDWSFKSAKTSNVWWIRNAWVVIVKSVKNLFLTRSRSMQKNQTRNSKEWVC